MAVRRLVQPSGEAWLQVLISLLRSLCKNEHQNTQAGELTMKHQTGSLPCQVFKVSQRKLVVKDCSGTHRVLMHSIHHGFLSFFKKLSFKSISPKVTCSVSLLQILEKCSWRLEPLLSPLPKHRPEDVQCHHYKEIIKASVKPKSSFYKW